MSRYWFIIAAVVAAAFPVGYPAAAGQTAAQAQAAQDDDSLPDDIVVEGYRQSKPIDARTRVPAAVSAVRNRQAYALSERLAACAARSKLSKLSRLRAVVDGEFNSATQVTAQDRLKRIYITCSESASLLSFTSAPQSTLDIMAAVSNDATGTSGFTNGAPLGRSIYDRGAFTIQALKLFAPDLQLTRAETFDPAVQTRFNAREVPRNRFRFPADYRYFQTAVCMVRLEPRLAVRLAKSEGGARFSDVQEALIDRTRECLGGARNVKVDPTQFRIYIADAVYRWAVAAHNTASLIPTD